MRMDKIVGVGAGSIAQLPHRRLLPARDKSTGSTGDRDSYAAGRSRDACADEETRGGKGDYTGGGRHDGRGCEEWCARVHRGIRDRGNACGGVCGDAAQRVGGSAGDDE